MQFGHATGPRHNHRLWRHNKVAQLAKVAFLVDVLEALGVGHALAPRATVANETELDGSAVLEVLVADVAGPNAISVDPQVSLHLLVHLLFLAFEVLFGLVYATDVAANAAALAEIAVGGNEYFACRAKACTVQVPNRFPAVLLSAQ